jgi:hypothetical protein
MLNYVIDASGFHHSILTWAKLIIWYRVGPLLNRGMMRTSSIITCWQKCNMGRSLVVVEQRLCESHNPTLLSMGRGSHFKMKSHPSSIRLVFWGDRAFRANHTVLRLRDLGNHDWCVISCGTKIAKAQQEALVAFRVCDAKLHNQCIGLSSYNPCLGRTHHFIIQSYHPILAWARLIISLSNPRLGQTHNSLLLNKGPTLIPLDGDKVSDLPSGEDNSFWWSTTH